MHRTPPPTRATSPAPTTSTETPKKTRPVRVAEKLSPPPLSTLDITNKESYQETIRVLVEKIDNAIRQGKSVTAYNKNLILNTAAWIQEATTKYFQDIHPKENRQDTETKEIQMEPEPKNAPIRQNQTGPLPPPAAKTAAAPDIMMEEINKRLQNIEMKLEKNMAVQRSYASVTATAPQRQQARPTLHSMVISSKNEEHTSEQVLNKVRETINAKEGWVTVEKVRKVRDRKVVVGFASAEECKKVQNRFSKQETGLLVEALKNKDPLLVLKDVLKYNTDEDIIKAIRNQNSLAIALDQRVWDQLVPKIQFAVNSSVNEVTGYTPSFLVYGRELVACGSHYIDTDNAMITTAAAAPLKKSFFTQTKS
ncbi:unnamed protein product [Euphydryas editha]|uniref:Uncharacterized protein n=1 Tax=Euphydryas editha TaxID=104508 RepID=A0AAU9VDH4_EUPED|nr:unnamed protein product [Euphydryas editha]